MTLRQFLEARINEDEMRAWNLSALYTNRTHEAKRLTAEVNAKREIIKWARGYLEREIGEWGTPPVTIDDYNEEPIMVALASVYADHEDYGQWDTTE